jgi:hypothetical protein
MKGGFRVFGEEVIVDVEIAVLVILVVHHQQSG